MENGEWVRFVTLSEAFFRYLPWINLSGILTIALNIWLLRQGIWSYPHPLDSHRPGDRWNRHRRCYAARAILADNFPQRGADAEAGNTLTKQFGIMIPIVLLIVIVVSTIEIVKDIVECCAPAKPPILLIRLS